MIQIKVFTKEDTENGYDGTVLTHLKPRLYMCGYSFEQLLKYARKELYWADIKEEEITGFEIFNKREQWVEYIGKVERSMEKKTTLHEFYLMYQNDELQNEIIAFNPQLKHFTLTTEKLSKIYDKGMEYLTRNKFERKLLECIVKWFNYDISENKFVICLKYEDWMKDYE